LNWINKWKKFNFISMIKCLVRRSKTRWIFFSLLIDRCKIKTIFPGFWLVDTLSKKYKINQLNEKKGRYVHMYEKNLIFSWYNFNRFSFFLMYDGVNLIGWCPGLTESVLHPPTDFFWRIEIPPPHFLHY